MMWFDEAEQEQVQTKTKEREPIPEVELRETRIATRGERSEYRDLLAAVAQIGPRDARTMIDQATRIGEMLGGAGFYRWTVNGKRGPQTIQGASVDLAYALAQAWGRCLTRVELISQSGSDVSLRGMYVDLQTLAVTERPYLASLRAAPGKYAQSPEEADRWRTMQLQGAASKAVRGAILAGLPGWYVDAALQAALRTDAAEATKGKTLVEARKGAVDFFRSKGLTVEDLESWVGLPVGLWASAELSRLRVLGAEIIDGRTAPETLKAAVPTADVIDAEPEPVADRVESLIGPAPTPTAKPAPTEAENQARAAALVAEAQPDPVREAEQQKRREIRKDCKVIELRLTPDALRAARTGAGLPEAGPGPNTSSQRLWTYFERLQEADVDQALAQHQAERAANPREPGEDQE